MSMTKSSRTELRTLREVAHFLLPLVCCEFCGEPLLDPKLADKVFGNKTHSPLKFLKLTTHHRNGKHGDNTGGALKTKYPGGMPLTLAISGNKSLTHRPCHGEHEMTLSHKKKGLKKVKPIRERAKDYLKIIFPLKGKDNNLTIYDWRFITMIRDMNRKVTRYEIRRLKKLAAKAEGRSVKTKPRRIK